MISKAGLQRDWPDVIARETEGFCCTLETIGCSGADVYRCEKKNKLCFLKIEDIGEQSVTEKQMLSWLDDKLPVPRILAEEQWQGKQYLLLSALPGEMACSKNCLQDPFKTVRLLAEGLLSLWRIDISACPSWQTLEHKLVCARKRVEAGLVNMEDLDSSHRCFDSAEQILAYLESRRPKEEQLVFSHGDYCLPNIFFAQDKVSGYLDLGRAGVADIWQDIALCIRSIAYNLPNRAREYQQVFFAELGIAPDRQKIDYYLLLDELF